jgi:hypothetical protein
MNLYQQIISLCTPYFGDVAKAEQFLTRQCRAHLNREPQDLQMNDLWNLAHWTMISGGLVLGKAKAEELSDKIRDLRKVMAKT